MLGFGQHRRIVFCVALLVSPMSVLGEANGGEGATSLGDTAATKQTGIPPILDKRISPTAISQPTDPMPESGRIAFESEGFATGQMMDPAYGQVMDPAYGQMTDPAYGQMMDPAYGQMTDPAYGQMMDPAYGQAMDPAYGQAMDPGYGQMWDPAYGEMYDPGYTPGRIGSYGSGRPAYPSVPGNYGFIPQSGDSVPLYRPHQMAGNPYRDDLHRRMLERLDAIVDRLERIEQVLREGR